MLAVLAALVDRSMIMRAGPARFRMLETVRRYYRGADPDPQATLVAFLGRQRAERAQLIVTALPATAFEPPARGSGRRPPRTGDHRPRLTHGPR